MISYYHQLDPFLVQFTSNFGIRWYSMAYILAVVFAYFAGVYLIQKGRIELDKTRLMDIVIFGAIGAVAGGRFGYCVFYAPELFLSFDRSFPFWGVLKIHHGGMSSHGGIIGFLLFMVFYARHYKISFFSIVDLAGLSGSFGIFLGRIANFINGELYGRVVEGKTWLAVRFPSELYLWADHPSFYKKQLLALKDLLPSLKTQSSVRIPGAYTWENWVNQAVEGNSVYEGYVSYICSLIVQNAHKPVVKEILEPLLFLRYPSQLYQSFFGGLMPFLIVCFFWRQPRKAGTMGLLWAVSYLFFRLFTEFYRQPDSHIGFQLFDLTRGQWLSFFLFGVVIGYGYLVYKREPKGFHPAN